MFKIKTNLKSATLAMMALCSATAWASYPDGYYDSLDGKSGLDLKRAVKAVAADHKAISYGTSTWNAFRSTDVITLNGEDYWWDMPRLNNPPDVLPVSALQRLSSVLCSA